MQTTHVHSPSKKPLKKMLRKTESEKSLLRAKLAEERELLHTVKQALQEHVVQLSTEIQDLCANLQEAILDCSQQDQDIGSLVAELEKTKGERQEDHKNLLCLQNKLKNALEREEETKKSRTELSHHLKKTKKELSKKDRDIEKERENRARIESQKDAAMAVLEREKGLKLDAQKAKSYYRRKAEEAQEKYQTSATELEEMYGQQVKELEGARDQLHTALEEVKNGLFSGTKDDQGRYTNRVRLACMAARDAGVARGKVATLIRQILGTFVDKDMSQLQLPQKSCVGNITQECGALGKIQVGEAMLASDGKVTHQYDGVTKNMKHYFAHRVCTSAGSFSAGLVESVDQTASAQLDSTKFFLSQIAEILSTTDAEKSETLNKLVTSINSTMSDRCVVNKSYKEQFEEYRASILPLVITEWDSLDDESRHKCSQVHDFYCGLHLLTNMAEYAEKALKGWEESVAEKATLGRFKTKEFLHWGGNESRTQLMVRSACNLLQPHGNESMATYHEQWEAFLRESGRKSALSPFRGERFNIIFHNGGALYYHMSDIKEFYECYVTAQDLAGNRLLRAVQADVNDDILMASSRALGILNKLVTTPLWHAVESDKHILDMARYYQQLKIQIERWSKDASSLLEEEAVFGEDFAPEKTDPVYISLFTPTTESLTKYTKEALELICSHVAVMVTRQLWDHLEEGRYNTSSITEDLRQATINVPTSQRANESDCAQLDHDRLMRPSATTAARETKVMMTQNKTVDWCQSLPEEKRDQYMNMARKKAPLLTKQSQERNEEQRIRRKEKMTAKKNKKQANQEKKAQRRDTVVEKVVAGDGLCKSSAEVDSLLNANDQKQNKTKLKNQIRYHKIMTAGCTTGLDKKCFQLSSGGVEFGVETLATNLKQIIVAMNSSAQPVSETATVQLRSPQEKEQLQNKLKRQQQQALEVERTAKRHKQN
ncbi:myosin-9-like [Branchiostoma lanceolatum]|uniref:myosin-9-like n=1 Tax=Branchiostoma lanceolatum TaxID=7740 RepID=UPI003455A71A